MNHLYTLEDYRKSLERDFQRGLLDPEEYAEALTRISPPNIGKRDTTIHLDNCSDDDPTVMKLEDLYYRELFGRTRNESDAKLPTQALLASIQEKPAGALWYASEPARSYRHCIYLDMLYVREEFRGSKVGTNLLLELLSHREDEHGIVTYAWKPVVEFYLRHGFLPTEQEEEKEEELFQKMILPLTKGAFQHYAQQQHEEALECYEETIAAYTGKFGSEFWERMITAIDRFGDEENQDFARNPFTVFIYRRAGLEHVLLK